MWTPHRIAFLWLSIVLTMGMPGLLAQTSSGAPSPDVIQIDASAPAHPFPHFWEKMFGSERAIVTLRESYRNR